MNSLRTSRYATQLTYDYLHETTGKQALEPQINRNNTELAFKHFIKQGTNTANTERAKMETMLKHIDTWAPEVIAQHSKATREATEYNSKLCSDTNEHIYHHVTKSLIQNLQNILNREQKASDVTIINSYIDIHKQIASSTHTITKNTQHLTDNTMPHFIARTGLDWTGPEYTDEMKQKWTKLNAQIRKSFLKSAITMGELQLEEQKRKAEAIYLPNKTLLKLMRPTIQAILQMHTHRQEWTYLCEKEKYFKLPQSFQDIIHQLTLPTPPYTHTSSIYNLYDCMEPYDKPEFNIFNEHNFNGPPTYTPPTTDELVFNISSNMSGNMSNIQIDDEAIIIPETSPTRIPLPNVSTLTSTTTIPVPATTLPLATWPSLPSYNTPINNQQNKSNKTHPNNQELQTNTPSNQQRKPPTNMQNQQHSANNHKPPRI
jgi:hypothetical protein